MATMLEPDRTTRTDPISDYVKIDRRKRRFLVDRRAYNDPEIFAKERALIFNRCWLYVGHDSELPAPGTFVARHVGGRDLIFSRDRKGEVHVFFNACTHRGSTLCRDAKGTAKSLTCPYHGWVFGLDGQLRDQSAKSGYDTDFNDDGAYNLRPVPKLDSYRDFYFINYNPKAISLDAYLGEAKKSIDFVADQSAAGLEVVEGAQIFSSYGNWKLLIENSYDAYHGPALHQSYFEFLDTRVEGDKMVDTQSGRGKGLGNGHGIFEIKLRSGRPVAQWIPPFGEAAKPKLAAVKAELVERLGEEYAERVAEHQKNMIIFPNLVVNDNLAVSVRSVWPTSPTRMDVSVWALAPKGEDPMLRKIRLDNYLTFIGPAGFATPDDIEAFELCQRGNDFGPGGYSDMSKGMTADEDPMFAEGDFLDEAQMRSWWAQWDRIIGGDDALSI